MSAEGKLIAWLLSVAMVLLSLYGMYRYGRHVEALDQTAERDKAVAEQQEKNRLALLAYAKKITDAGVQHDQDQAVVNRLSADLRRVSIHIPTCPVPGVAEAATDSHGGSGVLSEKVDGIFADFQAETGRLIERCDQLNIDARRANQVSK